MSQTVVNTAHAAPAAPVPAPPSGYIHGFVLSGAQAGRRIAWEELAQRQLCVAPEIPPREDELDCEAIWLHMDYSSPVTQQWLMSQTGLGDVVIEALLREEARPRVSAVHNKGVLMSLRSINFSAESSPEDMVAVRIWSDSRIVLSTRRRHVLSIAHLVEEIEAGNGPDSASSFIAHLTEKLIGGMQETISDVEDAVDDCEEKALLRSSPLLRTDVANIRRQAIALRRYLAPQREALSNLINGNFSWINADDRLRLRESNDHLHRYIEDLDAVRDRAAVTQEELASRVAEQVNSRMYILSLVAAIFLPLGFITGLLGVNLGGIPGSGDPQAFWVLGKAMLLLVTIQVVLFKLKHWF